MNSLIFLGGEKPSPELSRLAARRSGRIIAADKGYHAAVDTGVQPDVVTGDFDSIGTVPESPGLQVMPAPEQDATDFEKALRQLPADTQSIEILGGTGLRSDHFLTNLLIAAGLPPHLKVVFHDDTQSIFRITSASPFSISLPRDTVVSLIPFSTCSRVKTTGLHWDLKDATMGPGEQLGQSNRVETEKVRIQIGDGRLYAVINHPHGLEGIDPTD
ncbi:MAG: thiamine diphosphokinase [Puniceicoccaceae bacterium]